MDDADSLNINQLYDYFKSLFEEENSNREQTNNFTENVYEAELD